MIEAGETVADTGDEVEDALGAEIVTAADKNPSKPGCFLQPHPQPAPHPSETYIQFTIPSGLT
jgi:hypothetical protein